MVATTRTGKALSDYLQVAGLTKSPSTFTHTHKKLTIPCGSPSTFMHTHTQFTIPCGPPSTFTHTQNSQYPVDHHQLTFTHSLTHTHTLTPVLLISSRQLVGTSNLQTVELNENKQNFVTNFSLEHHTTTQRKQRTYLFHCFFLSIF